MDSTTRTELLLALNLLACGGMLGVTWMVQLVTYPRFVDVPAERWAAFHARHGAHITLVVFPLMLLELGCSTILAMDVPAGVPDWIARGGALLALLAWLLTALVSVPVHRRLAQGPDSELLARLVRTHWLRTATWSLHAVAATAMVVLAG